MHVCLCTCCIPSLLCSCCFPSMCCKCCVAIAALWLLISGSLYCNWCIAVFVLSLLFCKWCRAIVACNSKNHEAIGRDSTTEPNQNALLHTHMYCCATVYRNSCEPECLEGKVCCKAVLRISPSDARSACLKLSSCSLLRSNFNSRCFNNR